MSLTLLLRCTDLKRTRALYDSAENTITIAGAGLAITNPLVARIY